MFGESGVAIGSSHASHSMWYQVIASTAIWMYIASREYITLQVLKFGWFAVLMAMLISSGGGML